MAKLQKSEMLTISGESMPSVNLPKTIQETLRPERRVRMEHGPIDFAV